MRSPSLRRIRSGIKIAQPRPTAPSEQFLKCPPVIELFVFLFITLIINLHFSTLISTSKPNGMRTTIFFGVSKNFPVNPGPAQIGLNKND